LTLFAAVRLRFFCAAVPCAADLEGVLDFEMPARTGADLIPLLIRVDAGRAALRLELVADRVVATVTRGTVSTVPTCTLEPVMWLTRLSSASETR
jgi:hypothetical protein